MVYLTPDRISALFDMTDRVPLFVIALVLIELILGLSHVLFVGLFPIHDSVSQFFNLNEEGNLPAWFSSIQLFCISALLSLFFLGKRAIGIPAWGMLLGSLGFLFLSLDEGGKVHERVGTVLDAFVLGQATTLQEITHNNHGELLLPVTGYWMFFLGPLALAAFFVWWKSIKHFLQVCPAGRNKILFGTLIFLGSATIPEILANFVVGNLFAMHAEILVEELGEMLGMTVCLWGVFDLCITHSIQLKFGSSETVRDHPPPR